MKECSGKVIDPEVTTTSFSAAGIPTNDDLTSKRGMLVDASSKLLALAEWCENNYRPAAAAAAGPTESDPGVEFDSEFPPAPSEDVLTTFQSKVVGSSSFYGQQQDSSCWSGEDPFAEPRLEGCSSLETSGEYAVKALCAMTTNITSLAQSTFAKLDSVMDELQRVEHEVGLIFLNSRLIQHQRSLNSIKKLTVERWQDPDKTAAARNVPSDVSATPFRKLRRFSSRSPYVRKPIDYSIYDGTGHGVVLTSGDLGGGGNGLDDLGGGQGSAEESTSSSSAYMDVGDSTSMYSVSTFSRRAPKLGKLAAYTKGPGSAFRTPYHLRSIEERRPMMVSCEFPTAPEPSSPKVQYGVSDEKVEDDSQGQGGGSVESENAQQGGAALDLLGSPIGLSMLPPPTNLFHDEIASDPNIVDPGPSDNFQDELDELLATMTKIEEMFDNSLAKEV